jgi:hypothetical protein
MLGDDQRYDGWAEDFGIVQQRKLLFEYSHEKDFYSSRKWGYPISEHSFKERSSKEKPKPSPLEEDLFNNPGKYKERWKELREKGMLS